MNTDKIYAEQLANEYAPKDTSKVVALRKLDAKAKLPANVFTYTFGIITALVAGVGMCLSMKVIGNGSTAMFVLGVIVGIIGLLGMGVNYPIYKKLLAQGKQKYAFEKTIDLPEGNYLPGAARLWGELEYCNCRSVSEHRIDIRGAYTLNAAIGMVEPVEFITNLTGCGVEQWSQQLNGIICAALSLIHI